MPFTANNAVGARPSEQLREKPQAAFRRELRRRQLDSGRRVADFRAGTAIGAVSGRAVPRLRGGVGQARNASKKDRHFPVAIAALFGHIGAACGPRPRERV